MSEIKTMLNVKEALSRICNDEDLYRMLLEKFHAKYKDAAETTQSLIQNEGMEPAMIQVHSIKGLLGNVGADEAAECARKLEMALKAGNPDHKSELKAFQVEFNAAVRAIEDYLG